MDQLITLHDLILVVPPKTKKIICGLHGTYIYILPDWAVTLIIVWLHSVEPNIFAIAVIKYIYYFQERKNRLEQSRFNVDNVQRRIAIHQPFEDAFRALHEYHATQKFAERRA